MLGAVGHRRAWDSCGWRVAVRRHFAGLMGRGVVGSRGQARAPSRDHMGASARHASHNRYHRSHRSTVACTWFAPTSSHFLHFCSDLACTCMVDASAELIADLVLEAYSKLNFRPPEGQFTILAGFVLQNSDSELKLISLGTGSKCLPASRLPVNGDAVHDSHAEVLARRGAVRWLLEEITRSCSTPAESTSPWLCRQSDGKFALKAGTALTMYISTVPCKHVPCLLLVCRCGSLTGTARWRRLHQVLGVVPGSADGRA